jgi:hypothetical protein
MSSFQKLQPSSEQPNAEDAEDHEIFDINDFTTASDWERFFPTYFSHILKNKNTLLYI